MAVGPKIIAPKPIPVGCEQLPVSDGSFSADSTKVKAAETPKIIFNFGLFLIFLLIEDNPRKINGIHSAPQEMLHNGDKNPSIICIANTVLGRTNAEKSTPRNKRFFLVIILLLSQPLKFLIVLVLSMKREIL